MYEDGEISDDPSRDRKKIRKRPRSPSPKHTSGHRSHKTKHRSSEQRHRSSDPRPRSPDSRPRSPDSRSRSPDSRPRSPDSPSMSPDSRRRSTDKYRSPHTQSKTSNKPRSVEVMRKSYGESSSSDYSKPRKQPRSPSEHAASPRYTSSDPKIKRKELSYHHSGDSYDSSSSNRSPTLRYEKESPRYRIPKRDSMTRPHSPPKPMRRTDDDDKRKHRSPEPLPTAEEFNNVIANMKTEKDADPSAFNQNFQNAIEQEFSSEMSKAMSYLLLRFQVILEMNFDKAFLEDKDKNKIMKRLQSILKKRVKKLKLNRFMLEMDIVTEYKNMYKSATDTELIKKLMEDVSYVEIVEEEAIDVKPPPELDVDNRMWDIVEEVLNGLNLDTLDDDAETVILEKIKEEEIDEKIKIKNEPQTATDFDPNITIKQEPLDPDTEMAEETGDPKTDVNSETTAENEEPVIRIKTEPIDESETTNEQPLVKVKTEPIDTYENTTVKTEPNQTGIQIPKKVKKRHVRKVFDYPDISLKPIPENPQFYITTKNVEKQMRRHVPVVSNELNLCLGAMDMLIVSDLIKTKLRKKIKKLLKNKTYMRSSEITKLFREHHPSEVDRKFVKKVLKSFKKGPKPPKVKKVKVEVKTEKPDADDEVKIIEVQQKPITLDDDTAAKGDEAAVDQAASIGDEAVASNEDKIADSTTDGKIAASTDDDKMAANTTDHIIATSSADEKTAGGITNDKPSASTPDEKTANVGDVEITTPTPDKSDISNVDDKTVDDNKSADMVDKRETKMDEVIVDSSTVENKTAASMAGEEADIIDDEETAARIAAAAKRLSGQ